MTVMDGAGANVWTPVQPSAKYCMECGEKLTGNSEAAFWKGWCQKCMRKEVLRVEKA
jgi:hypothetical protein